MAARLWVADRQGFEGRVTAKGRESAFQQAATRRRSQRIGDCPLRDS